MSDNQPETLPSGEEFDSWLMGATLDELEEFIREAPQGLSDRRLPQEFLQDCKARVDARLAAEPESTVLTMSDPHQMRILCWEQIAERFQAEIKFRSGKAAISPQDSNPGKSTDVTAPNERERFVRPILEKKAWSTFQFALEADVDFHTANDYLNGKNKPNRTTRARLAKALEVPVEKLPK